MQDESQWVTLMLPHYYTTPSGFCILMNLPYTHTQQMRYFLHSGLLVTWRSQGMMWVEGDGVGDRGEKGKWRAWGGETTFALCPLYPPSFPCPCPFPPHPSSSFTFHSTIKHNKVFNHSSPHCVADHSLCFSPPDPHVFPWLCMCGPKQFFLQIHIPDVKLLT